MITWYDICLIQLVVFQKKKARLKMKTTEERIMFRKEIGRRLARRWKSLIPWENLKAISLLPLLFAYGCAAALMEDIQISSYMQKKQHYEVINALEPKLEKTDQTSSFQLFLLAGAYYEIRDYQKLFKTIDHLEKKIASGEASFYGADLTVYPKILRGLAYLDQGEHKRAIREAEEAYALLNQPKGKSNHFYRAQLIQIASILGIAHANLNGDSEVERYLTLLENLDVTQSNLGPEKYIAIARINMARKRFDKALAAVKNPASKVEGSLTIFYDQTFQELPKFFILTKCLYETGKIREAREGYDQLLSHPQIKQIGGLYWPVLLDRAKIALGEGEQELAEQLLKEAVEVIEKQRSSIKTEAGRIGYVGDKQAVYQELISLFIARGRPTEAFEYTERAKARALVDLLASQKHIASHSRNVAQTETTFRELAKAENDLNIVNEPRFQQETSRARGILLALKKDLAEQAPEFASLVSVTKTSIREIQDRLSDQETLLEYYATERNWFAFVLRREGILAKKLGSFDLRKEVQEFREALVNPASGDYVRRSRDLYRKLIEPVSDLLKTKKLIVVPHGVLHYLPFNALSSGDGYLIDRMNVRLLPSASVLKFLKDKVQESDPKVLIIGNPNLGDPAYDLKYAQEEALAIATLMPKATVLLRDKAGAASFHKMAGQFAVIHFAAHGLFDPQNPLESALLLSRDRESDGRLRVGDLYKITLNADLVTLSACETALGKISQGDEVVGFTRGFLYAGARSIVSSLWKVDDRATKDLMVDLYRSLLKMGKDEALRQAQLNTKRKYPHPFYWASFQLIGRAN